MKVEMISQRHRVIVYDDVFEGYNLNIHIICGEHRTYVIDTGLGQETANDILKVIGNSKQPIIVINTHSHWDHVWGNGFLDAQYIIAHSLCLGRLIQDFDDEYQANKTYQRGSISKVLPNLVFDQQLDFADDGIILGFAPGHTNHDIFIYDQVEQVLNVGDNIGDTHNQPLPELEMSKQVYMHSLQTYQSFDIKTLVSGHNHILDKKFLDIIINSLL